MVFLGSMSGKTDDNSHLKEISGFDVCANLHCLQPLRLPGSAREQTTASHSWPLLQRHHTLLLVPTATSLAVRSPFFVGCHSAATSGQWIESRFASVTRCPAQYGHPRLRGGVRLFTLAGHSWPCLQRHHAFLGVPTAVSSGFASPFFVGCHSAATSGHWSESLFASVTTLPAHDGQPVR